MGKLKLVILTWILQTRIDFMHFAQGVNKRVSRCCECMLEFFYIYEYTLLESGATLSFVTSFIAKNVNILSDIMREPFKVITTVGESMESV